MTGWDARFRDLSGDGTEPGTVFETHVHSEKTTWIVVDRKPGRMMSYARVTPGARAGTVTVTVERLSSFLRSWQDAIMNRATREDDTVLAAHCDSSASARESVQDPDIGTRLSTGAAPPTSSLY